MSRLCNRILALLCFTLFTTDSFCLENGYLTNEEISLFHKQGYLIKKGCLDKHHVEELTIATQQAIETSLASLYMQSDELKKNEDSFIEIQGSRIVYRASDENISIARINGCGGLQPSLLETLQSHKMVHTFFELLGTNKIEHLICQIHPKLPLDGISFKAHRDIEFRKSFDPNWTDILGNGSWAICIIPIDPMSEKNGGLWIDTGSFGEQSQENILWVKAEPGDMLFLHPYILHGSGPNLSDKPRRTLLTGFCAYEANHKAYPGSHVNYCFSIDSENTITKQLSPWANTKIKGDGH